MRKKFRKITAIVLTVAMAFSVVTPVFADDQISTEDDPYMALKAKSSLYVQNWVNKNYVEHYILSDYKSQILSFEVKDNKLETHLLVEMKTTLKYNDVESLPYMQGLKSLLNVDSVENLLDSSDTFEIDGLNQVNGIVLSDTQKRNALERIREQYEDASECIGVATPLTVDFVLKADVVGNNLTNIELYEATNGYLELAEPFKTYTELYNKAQTTLINYLSSEDSQKMSVVSANSATVVYDRVKARDYALTYTSNGINSCNCGSLVGSGDVNNPKGVDYSKWNNEEYPYESRFCHNDCADYVSQALVAGGFETSTAWNRNQTSWVNVTDLCNYLIGLGAAAPIDYDYCVAGHIVKMPGHVVMVTLNDTVDHRYSGHTNDRWHRTLNEVSTWTYYSVVSY